MISSWVALLLIAAPLATAPASVATSETSRIPPEHFAAQPFIYEPILSPDGRWIAAKRTAGGQEQLVVYDRRAPHDQDAKLVPLTGQFGWFGWAGDKLLVERREISDVASMLVPVGRLSAFDLAKGALVPLGKGIAFLGSGAVHVDPAGRFVLVASSKTPMARPGVDRIDLATGETVRIERPARDIMRWFADATGTIRAGMSFGQSRWKLFFRDAPGGPLRPIESARYDENSASDIGTLRLVSPDGRGFVMTNGPTGRYAVYAYDFRTDTFGDVLFAHPDADVLEATSDPATGALESVVWEDDRRRVRWFDPAMAALQRQIDRTFPDKENVIVNKSRDGKQILFVSRAAHDPGTYYVFDRNVRQIQPFAVVIEEVADAQLAPVTSIRYLARDKLPIPGYLTLPVGKPPRSLPLIVLPHGGPFARDRWTYDPFVQHLANLGYAVLQPNFRGSTGFGREFIAKAYGQWGRAMQDDIDDGVDHLTAAGTIDSKRVCIMGASYGGYAAIWGAMRNPERYRCAIGLAAVTDLKSMLVHDSRQVPYKYFKHWKAQVQGSAQTDMEAVSPLRQASKLSVPLLLAHGQRDDNVPPQGAQKLASQLRKLGKPVELVLYPQAGHSLTRPQDLADFLRRVEAFLAKHNPVH